MKAGLGIAITALVTIAAIFLLISSSSIGGDGVEEQEETTIVSTTTPAVVSVDTSAMDDAAGLEDAFSRYIAASGHTASRAAAVVLESGTYLHTDQDEWYAVSADSSGWGFAFMPSGAPQDANATFTDSTQQQDAHGSSEPVPTQDQTQQQAQQQPAQQQEAGFDALSGMLSEDVIADLPEIIAEYMSSKGYAVDGAQAKVDLSTASETSSSVCFNVIVSGHRLDVEYRKSDGIFGIALLN